MGKYTLLFILPVMILFTGCNSGQQLSESEISLLKKEIEQKDIERAELLIELDRMKLAKTQAQKKLMDSERQIKILDDKLEMAENEIISMQNDMQNNKDSNTNLGLKIIDVRDDQLFYVLKEETNSAQTVYIVGSNIDGLVEEYEEITIDGHGDGELFKVEVIGSIHDFQLVSIEWDESLNALVELGVKKEISEVRNQTIIIETYLPCGIPFEKIKWKDENGTENEILLSNDGYGFSGSIIWNK